MSLAQRIAALDERLFIIFVGGTTNQRALACHAVTGLALHLEPVATIDELSAADLIRADVLLAWDEDETILELARCLAPLGCRTPIVAIGESPTARQVVGALEAGAIDYVEWPCDRDSLSVSLLAAYEKNEQSLPVRERQIAARQALQSLSRREHQVLAALSQGLSNKEIARELGISPRTVEIHRANLMRKIHAKHSADAIRLVLEASMPTSPFLRIDNPAMPSPARNYPLAPLPTSVARLALG